MSGLVTLRPSRAPSYYAAACVSCVDSATAVEAARLCDHSVVKNVTLVGRCAYISTSEHSTEKAARASARAVADAIVYSLGRKKSKVAAVVTDTTKQPLLAEVTVPGPILQRSLGVTVGDLAHAKSRIDLAASSDSDALRPFKHFFSTRALDSFARAVNADRIGSYRFHVHRPASIFFHFFSNFFLIF